MDRLARTWVVQRIVLHLKVRRDQDSKRLSQVRDLLAGVRWEDLAPCEGCHLPFEKANGVHCAHCLKTLACSAACDPWRVNKCEGCQVKLCEDCSHRNPLLAPYEIYCSFCEPSSNGSNNSDAE